MFLLLVTFQIQLHGDWRDEIRRFLTKAHEFDKVAVYVEGNLHNIPVEDRAGAVIILCYAYSELGDRVNEEKWLSRYFDRYQTGSYTFSFLQPAQRVKIFEYIDAWTRKFPKIKRFRLDDKSRRFRYFHPPEKIIVEIDSQAPAEITIITPQNRTIYSGYLQRGTNHVEVPVSDGILKTARNPLKLTVKAGTIEVTKNAVLAGRCEYPDDVHFHRESGELGIRGEVFKPETSETVVYKTRRRFDKRYFLNKALANLGSGIKIFALNRLLIYGPSRQADRSSRSKAVLKGLNAAANVMAVGLSLKGVVHIFKSFKKEELKQVRTTVDREAVIYNRTLQEKLRQARENIYINLEIELRENGEQT